ncbi:MAG: cation:proton antiporter [Christensenellaceae bacterium]
MTGIALTVTWLAIAVLCGLLMTRLANLLKLPNVTAYLVAGLILSPYTFKLMKPELLESFSILSTIALGFIAFSIGFCFKIGNLKALGSKIYTITVVQAVATAVLVDVSLVVLHLVAPEKISLSEVLVLGAIATATAPAATLLVVKQYKAHGIVTDTLLPVVAIDDAVGLIIFSVSLSVAKALATGDALTVTNMLLEPLKEIILSLLTGGAIGLLLSVLSRWFDSRANRITLIIIGVFLGVGLSEAFGLSSLLLCMMIGAVYCNLYKQNEKVMEVYDRWTHPLYIIFFVLSGAELNVRIIFSVGIIGIIYLVARSIGKYTGAFLGASLAKSDKNVRKYLGFTLLPQAGVAIGMSAVVMQELPQFGESVRTVVLCATLIYELVGPLITKIALKKAGEID